VQEALCALFFLLCLCVPFNSGAATLENADLDTYTYRIVLPHTSYGSKIYDQSMLFGICKQGCQIELIDSGQAINVKPDDHIVIEDGVIELKE
jgi:hypothetical protein